MPALKSRPKRIPGFGASLPPSQIVRNFTKNIPQLRESNIRATVQFYRDDWAADYPNRLHGPFTKEKLFEVPKPELKVLSQEEMDGRRIGNPNLIGMKNHFVGFYKHWSLHILTLPNGKKEFSFNVDAGNVSTWNPVEARNNILKYHDEETYRQWKRLVMSQWEECSQILIAEARKQCRGFRAWSVTSCESSARLMRNCPRVIVHQDVAFLMV